MTIAEARVEIPNELGLHLRAAAAFAKLAETFQCEVTLSRNGVRANGKSIIALVTLAASKGTEIRILAEGPDAHEALEALAGLVASGFGEEV